MTHPETRGLLALLLACSLTACSTLGQQSGEVSGTGEAIVAENLIAALAQVPVLNPMLNTVQMSEPTTSFGQRVEGLLTEVGYGMQTVDGDTGEFYVRYREETIRSELGLETSFLVAIGDVSAERSFDTTNPDRPMPLSPLYIAGAPEFDVQLDDAAFGTEVADVSYALFDNVSRPQVFDFDTESATVIDATDDSVVVSGVAQPVAPELANVTVRENMLNRDGFASNYIELFDNYNDIRSEVLVFDNDSMRLGDANKRVVQQYAEAFDPETDLVSIIGCSHGNTDVQNGNAVLALGRANRVKEAFMFAGLDSTKVLEEGCWAGDYFDPMPRRGVLLTLKRRAS